MDVTIKDIAKEMGVTPSTVSRALNGEYGVSDKSRDKIISKATELGYKPNAIARSLVTKRTYTIGLVAPDFSNTFFIDIAHAVRKYIIPLGFTLLMSDNGWSAKMELLQLKNLGEHRVDGIILKTCQNNFDYIESLNIPTVLINVLDGNKLHCIDTDNRLGGFLAAEHLILSGYKKIAYIGSNADPITNNLRLNGYLDALKKYGLRKKPQYIQTGEFKIESGRLLAEKLLKMKNAPDAVFCANDLIALGVLEKAHSLNIKTPDDFGIIGFDNMFFSSLSNIRLTTLAQNSNFIGSMAAKTIIDLINDKNTDVSKRIVTSPVLIPRETTRNI